MIENVLHGVVMASKNLLMKLAQAVLLMLDNVMVIMGVFLEANVREVFVFTRSVRVNPI